MNMTPKKPQNAADLKKLLSQYDSILTPQNKQFITELIQKLDSGGDKEGFEDLAKRMQKATKQPK